MARNYYVNFSFVNDVLTERRSFLDSSDSITEYPLGNYPSYFSVVDLVPSVNCDLFFSTLVGCYAFEIQLVQNDGLMLSVLNDSSYIFPETVVYFDIEGVYKYAGLPVPPLLGSLPSLNGNGCEYIDGAMVVSVGRPNVVYSVVRSSFQIYADNAYQVVYDLSSVDGHKLSVPESLLTAYVPPVTTP
ncbi:hypothetical protein Sulku_1336 [Sulfuricurvum kujiense DSM 16994]|uniref:Uncharacterized protein n=1 Tax=Sulfuricurvum kujiense (strain ATCC BAA-921 / DSM 16994 / JCM 11577 / YK-1) TaxID=709032 RepID=E4TY79_SULKY|nr:hypothetical protein [Sulfuricurvum kujiense]ADR33999.1 hypothetical protein Sulku_1336 [Sulfuricurvum kujiense DSM 16994]